MPSWKFLDYVDPFGRNYVEEWYQSQDAEVRAEFDATLLILRGTEDWKGKRVKEFKELHRLHPGLSEIKFEVEAKHPDGRKYQRHFRPAGIWRPQHRDFIILLGCEKSGRIYTPLNAFDTAMRHKADFEHGQGRTHERL